MSLSSIGLMFRSKFTLVFGVMVAAVFVLAACSSDAEVKTGGTIRVGTTPDSITLDPAFLTTNPDIWIAKSVYNNIVSWTHELTVQPELAVEWEANDALTSYTFKLRKDVKFHNGEDFTAEDVVFTIGRLIDKELASPALGQLDFITAVVAEDDYTVRFELEAPNAFLPEALALYQGKILDSGVDLDNLLHAANGTGAFMLEEHITGERAVLKRNPDYWDEGKPYVDEVIFFYMAESQTRLEALKSGTLDIVVPIGGSEAAGLQGVPGVKVDQVSSGSYMVMAMMTDVAPFDNKLVRQALQMATDREAISQAAYFGLGSVGGDHPIPPTDPYYNPDAAAPAYDPEGAKKLLAEAGYPDGITVTLHTAPVFGGLVDMAVAFKESAAAAGINVEISRDPTDSYWSKVWLVEPFQSVHWFHRDPNGALSITYKSDAPWNEAHYNNPKVDQLIRDARAAKTFDERKAIFGEIQLILTDDVPRIIPFFMPVLIAMSDKVEGVFAHPGNNFILKEARLNSN